LRIDVFIIDIQGTLVS
jgi:hypothetical protein